MARVQTGKKNQRGKVCSALCKNFDNQLPPKGGGEHIPRGDYAWGKECDNGCVHVLPAATNNLNLTQTSAKFSSLLSLLTNPGMTRHSPYSDPNRSSPPFGGYPPAIIQAEQKRFLFLVKCTLTSRLYRSQHSLSLSLSPL